MSTTYFYAVVREKLSGGQLLSQIAHAAREGLGPEPTYDERSVILVATKERMAQFASGLDLKGIPYKPIVETDGQMAGSTTAIGLSVTDGGYAKSVVDELVRLCELQLWKKAEMSGEAVRQWLQKLPGDAERLKFIKEAFR